MRLNGLFDYEPGDRRRAAICGVPALPFVVVPAFCEGMKP
jgi:hypothetical protein